MTFIKTIKIDVDCEGIIKDYNLKPSSTVTEISKAINRYIDELECYDGPDYYLIKREDKIKIFEEIKKILVGS